MTDSEVQSEFSERDGNQHQQKGDTKMMRKLMGREEVGADVVLALSGAVVVLISGGADPPSPGRLVAGMLSNPVPSGEGTLHPSVRATRGRAAA